jgi:prepilin-type N-terminal cleavage/methylation domain-containing protein
MGYDVRRKAGSRPGGRNRSNRGHPLPDTGQRIRAGFTLIELLLVVAIISILAALLLPSLATAQAKGKQAACSNHLKQLALGFHMYTADNDGRLVENSPASPWVSGNMKIPAESTNQALIRQGKLFPYANQPDLYRCPADPSQTGGRPRVRSYSMNCWMGSRYMETYQRTNGFRSFVRESELASGGPSRLWVILDENELSIDDAWFLVTMDDSRPFASLPAARHSRGYGLNFADAHVELFRLRDPLTGTEPGSQPTAKNIDWLRLKQVTTLR